VNRVLSGLDWRHAALPFGVVAIAAYFVSLVTGLDTVGVALGNALLVGGIIVLVLLIVAAPAVWRAGRNGIVVILAVALLFLVNLNGLSLPRVGFFAELEWNWQGKTLDLIWCLLLIGLLNPQVRREVGWTWETRPGTLPVAFVNIGILVIVGFVALGTDAVGGSTQGLTLERILFDASYPNLVEEIVFRGFMLALLDRAFGTPWTFAGSRIGWGVVLTAWLFGLAHGIWLDADGTLAFDPVYLVMTFVAGLVFGWIRALTGSLWPAYLAHAAPEAGILLALSLN
tara:strand:- start:230 stop:1084 length:855 start_codon:yes stop_codon:yes gene_type:complete